MDTVVGYTPGSVRRVRPRQRDNTEGGGRDDADGEGRGGASVREIGGRPPTEEVQGGPATGVVVAQEEERTVVLEAAVCLLAEAGARRGGFEGWGPDGVSGASPRRSTH